MKVTRSGEQQKFVPYCIHIRVENKNDEQALLDLTKDELSDYTTTIQDQLFQSIHDAVMEKK